MAGNSKKNNKKENLENEWILMEQNNHMPRETSSFAVSSTDNSPAVSRHHSAALISFLPLDSRGNLELSTDHPQDLGELIQSSKWFKHASKSFIDHSSYKKTLGPNYYSHLKDLQNVWENVEIPDTREECSNNLKFLIRKGIPDVCRGLIWKIITECKEFSVSEPKLYPNVLERVFGERVPKTVYNVPTFGGVFKPNNHHLTSEGIAVATRILCSLAMENPDIEYLPIIPDLVCIFLHFLPEAETYVSTYLMVKPSKRKNKLQYFTPTRKGILTWLYTFDDLLKVHVPKVAAKMKTLNITSHSFVDNWFLRLFVGVFPYQTVLTIFDSFLNEGSKILFRIALGFLKLKAKDLIECKTGDEFIATANKLAGELSDPDALLKKSFGLSMSRSQVHRYNLKNANRADSVLEPRVPVYYRPKITQHSDIVNDTAFELFWSWLPSHFRIRDPVLLFNTKTDGYSLKGLLQKIGKAHPIFLIIKTKEKDIFGAFISTSLQIDYKKYTGDRDFFVFRLVPKHEKWNWLEGCTDYFLRMTEKSIEIGGGHGIAISLDDELHKGRTESCTTFLNLPLTKNNKEDFLVSNIEIWGLK